MSEPEKLKIEEAHHDRYFETLMITGFTPKEMDEILSNGENALEKCMENHGMGDTFKYWQCGYGIYGIKHFGGHLLVTISNSCD